VGREAGRDPLLIERELRRTGGTSSLPCVPPAGYLATVDLAVVSSVELGSFAVPVFAAPVFTASVFDASVFAAPAFDAVDPSVAAFTATRCTRCRCATLCGFVTDAAFAGVTVGFGELATFAGLAAGDGLGDGSAANADVASNDIARNGTAIRFIMNSRYLLM
jgi:hypothetical protein